MKCLVACEYSGRVRSELRALGHDAWSCDLLPSEDDSPYHIQGYVDALLEQPWDLVIAHPPCTYLSNSGVRWLYPRDGYRDDLIENLRVTERWEAMRDAVCFFLDCMRANSPRVAVENPVMHKHAREMLVDYGVIDGYPQDGRPSFTVQPYQFGDPHKKRTCFWTRGLPPLKPTSDMGPEGAEQTVWKMGPSEDRWKERSRTYPGIAKAIAQQWGGSC